MLAGATRARRSEEDRLASRARRSRWTLRADVKDSVRRCLNPSLAHKFQSLAEQMRAWAGTQTSLDKIPSHYAAVNPDTRTETTGRSEVSSKPLSDAERRRAQNRAETESRGDAVSGSKCEEVAGGRPLAASSDRCRGRQPTVFGVTSLT